MYDTIEKARAMRDLLEEACFEFGDDVLEGVFRRAEFGEGIRATEGGDSLVERSAITRFRTASRAAVNSAPFSSLTIRKRGSSGSEGKCCHVLKIMMISSARLRGLRLCSTVSISKLSSLYK